MAIRISIGFIIVTYLKVAAKKLTERCNFENGFRAAMAQGID